MTPLQYIDALVRVATWLQEHGEFVCRVDSDAAAIAAALRDSNEYYIKGSPIRIVNADEDRLRVYVDTPDVTVIRVGSGQ